MKCCIRLNKIRSLTNLAAIQSHGSRLDPSSKGRVDADRTNRNIAFSAYCPDDPLSLVEAWQKAKVVLGASTYGQAPIAAHVLAIISPECIDAAGDRHDPKNAANILLAKEAVVWAEVVFGRGAFFAGRLDLDEAGAGVVDLCIMPVRERPMNGKSSKRIISLHGALDECRREHGMKTGFAALQTSWWRHAKKYIDTRLQRGVPKNVTARHHVHADVYRAVAATVESRVRAQAEARIGAEIDLRMQALTHREAQARRLLEQCEREQAVCEAAAAALEAARAELRLREDAIGSREKAAGDALMAIRVGVRAVLRGYVDEVDVDARGRSVPVFAPELTNARRQALTEIMRPGWQVGLREVLQTILEGGASQRIVDAPAP